MINRKKKIETVEVIVTSQQENLTFRDILNFVFNLEDATFTENNRDTDIRLLEDSDTSFVGIVNTTKRSGIPPKRDSVSKTYSPLQINPSRSGLGYPNVFLFEDRRNILLYEFNKNGCYLNYFKRYLEIITRRHDFVSFDIEFRPVLKESSYQRMLDMTHYKSIEIGISNPVEIMEEDIQSGALLSSTRQSTEAQSRKLTMIYKAGRGRTDSLNRNFVRTLIDSGINILNRSSNRNIKKVKLDGYYIDQEDGTSKKGEIDFILDRYVKKITITEPHILVDNQADDRLRAIRHLYRRCLDDFDTIFG